VPNGLERLKAAAKHGFTHALVPKANRPKKPVSDDLEIIGVQHVREALEHC
jgi:DNA repair protein RadA/Sms